MGFSLQVDSTMKGSHGMVMCISLVEQRKSLAKSLRGVSIHRHMCS